MQIFCGSMFKNMCDHAHYTLYSRAYFTGLFFADSGLSEKTVNLIGPLEISSYTTTIAVSIPLSVFIARYSSMECESLFLM
jgi:hypothetical protein